MRPWKWPEEKEQALSTRKIWGFCGVPSISMARQKPKILNPKPKIVNPKLESEIQNPKSKILNPKSKAQIPKPKIHYPEPKTQTGSGTPTLTFKFSRPLPAPAAPGRKLATSTNVSVKKSAVVSGAAARCSTAVDFPEWKLRLLQCLARPRP